jgi:hypothetical protein
MSQRGNNYDESKHGGPNKCRRKLENEVAMLAGTARARERKLARKYKYKTFKSVDMMKN